MNLEICTYALVIGANLGVGGRLLQRGRTLAALPELLLGASLTLDGIEWLFWVLAFYTPAADTPSGELLTAACRATIVVHNIFLLAFTRLVFRPESRAALILAVLSSVIMIVGLVVGVALGDWMGNRSDRIWLWLELGAEQVAYAWTLAESARYYARMRRRFGHGLADPVLANRFLLWAAYGAASVSTSLVWMYAAVVASGSGRYPFVLDLVMIGFTVVSATALWLAFFPPPFYRSWLASGARSASG